MSPLRSNGMVDGASYPQRWLAVRRGPGWRRPAVDLWAAPLQLYACEGVLLRQEKCCRVAKALAGR